MKHHIDPKVDCVFKALLGAEKNINLLIHFLNAILGEELQQPIVFLDILNPYNEKEFIGDKLSIVDVKARTADGRVFQVEIQLSSFPSLPARIAYNWADIYSQQLEEGKDYSALQPSYSIWLLAKNLIKDDNHYLHTFKLRDNDGRMLNNHGGIWLLELHKFNVDVIEFDEQRWLKFFKDGERLNDELLPEWMCTNEMRQAMNTLRVFSEKEREYFKYQARQEYLRQQRTIEREQNERLQAIEQKMKVAEEEKKIAEQAKEVAEQEKEIVKQEKEALEQEKEIVKQEKEALEQEKEIVKQEKEAVEQEKEQALLEVKRLMALLNQQKH